MLLAEMHAQACRDFSLTCTGKPEQYVSLEMSNCCCLLHRRHHLQYVSLEMSNCCCLLHRRHHLPPWWSHMMRTIDVVYCYDGDRQQTKALD